MTPDEQREAVKRHTFTQLEDTTSVVCLIEMKDGRKFTGVYVGGVFPTDYDFERACNVAYDKAFKAAFDLLPVTPTEDMKLPDGSAVLQIINAPSEDGTPNLDIRGVLINTTVYDPLNPTHRVLAVLNNRMPDLIREATGGEVQQKSAEDIQNELIARQAQIQQDQANGLYDQSKDPVSLSRGTRPTGMRPELAAPYGSYNGVEPLTEANTNRSNDPANPDFDWRDDEAGKGGIQHPDD